MNKDITLLKKVVEVYSPYGKEKKVAQVICEEMKKRGFRIRLDKASNVIGEIGNGKREILFIGHMDVYQGEIPVRIENNHLFGRGSVDAKGCIASVICGASNLSKKFWKDKKIIIVSCVEEEGISSKGARNLIKENKYNPEVLVIGEPSGWENVTIGYKGILSFDVNFEQDNFHYGSEGRRVINMAIFFCKDLIDKIENEKGKSNFDSPSVEIRDFRSNNNGIKESCYLSVVMRIPPNYSIKNLQKWIKNKLKDKRVKLKFNQADPATLSQLNSKLVRDFRKVIKNKNGKGTFVKKLGTSDMNILAPFYNTAVIAYGPGNSRLDHTPNENLDLDEYKKSIEVWKEVLELM